MVLESASGFRVTLINLGASIQSIQIPTDSGMVDAVLGYKNLDDYRTDSNFLGATVGRYANRIKNASFTLNHKTHRLDSNEQATGHCLHGGRDGFHSRFWRVEASNNKKIVTYHYFSPDDEGGFPGNLKVSVSYQLINDYSLSIDYEATSDADTVLSLSNHVYFNLDRQSVSTIDTHHFVSSPANAYTPKDTSNIPAGEIQSVDSTAFDLRQMTALQTNQRNLSFDHNFVMPNNHGKIQEVARLYSGDSGISLRVHSTQPAMQLYTADYCSTPFSPRQGICIETQAFPNAPNQTNFPSALVRAGDIYRQRTVFDFHFESQT